MRRITLIAHNLRSCHNVGSLLRTAEGLDVSVILSGYTPYPKLKNDIRLPHEIRKISRQIHKTALGAEETVHWERIESISDATQRLRQEGFVITALEQDGRSIPLSEFDPPDKLAVIVGREVEGIEQEILSLCDGILEIPMFGNKESFNVVQAAAMALYHARFR